MEGNGPTARYVATTVSNAWELMSWDFTGEPSNFNDIVFMFDFGNVGIESESPTFLLDDIAQKGNGTQIDLPVDFEGTTVNYKMSDFGRNVSSLAMDPENPSDMVIQAIKTIQAATWAVQP